MTDENKTVDLHSMVERRTQLHAAVSGRTDLADDLVANILALVDQSVRLEQAYRSQRIDWFAMREIVEAVASVQGVFWEDGYCPWCGEPVWMAPENVRHGEGCPITKARKLLNKS